MCYGECSRDLKLSQNWKLKRFECSRDLSREYRWRGLCPTPRHWIFFCFCVANVMAAPHPMYTTLQCWDVFSLRVWLKPLKFPPYSKGALSWTPNLLNSLNTLFSWTPNLPQGLTVRKIRDVRDVREINKRLHRHAVTLQTSCQKSMQRHSDAKRKVQRHSDAKRKNNNI